MALKKKTTAVTPNKKSAGAKKTSTGPAKKATPRKAAAKAAAPKKGQRGQKVAAPVAERNPREFDEHGFVIGSDSSKIVALMLEGGEGRLDINAKIADAINAETRNGNPKNVSSLVSGLLSRLESEGYTVEQSWRLLPPSGSKTVAGSSKASGTKAKPAKSATGRSKAPAKKGRKG